MSNATQENKIAIIGMACHFPGGANTPEAFWQNLRDGRDNRVTYGYEELLEKRVPRPLLDHPDYVRCAIPLDDMPSFDADFFGINRFEARLMDPQHRHFLECCWEALDIAGYGNHTDAQVGVFGGSGHNAYMPFNLLTNKEVMRDTDLLFVRHASNDKDFMTTRVSYCLDLHGPSINIQTACSTSLVAVHMACQSLLNGECDMALAGGATIEVPHGIGYLYREGEVFAPDGICRAFDIDSRGTIFGSGAGVVLLKLLEDAIDDGDRIDAVILASAVNNDGSRKAGYMAPSVEGQIGAVAEAMALANIDSTSVKYIEAHGTGTAIGDPIEVEALQHVYGSPDQTNFCALGSVKPNIGHLDTAAGVASLIKAVLCMQHEEIPGLLHHREPHPECAFEDSAFYVSGDWRPWDEGDTPRRAGVNSLGVGGTNAHLILEEAPLRDKHEAGRHGPLLFPLSAQNREALEGARQRLRFALAGPCADERLVDVAHTLIERKKHFGHRTSVVACDKADLIARLNEPTRAFDVDEEIPVPVFLFAGGGSQYPGMALKLAQNWPGFETRLEQCLALMPENLQNELRKLLYASEDQRERLSERFQDPVLAVPGIFAIQYALADLLIDELGIEPQAMIGHSLGDYAACTIAGVFALEEVIPLVCLRGELTATITNGGMISVLANIDELSPVLELGVEVASVNSPTLCVLSGRHDNIDAAVQKCEELELQVRRVPVKSAGHCSLLDPILDRYRAGLERISFSSPSRQVVCNATGAFLTAEEATSVDYWIRHLRHTVNFSQGASLLLEQHKAAFIEVGPGSTLSSFVRQHEGRGKAATTHVTMPVKEECADELRQLFGELWAQGLPVDWARVQTDGNLVPLPPYAFNKSEYWIETESSELDLHVGAATNAESVRNDLDAWLYQHQWLEHTCGEFSASSATNVMLFDDGSALFERIASQYESGGANLVRITLDAIDALELSIDNPQLQATLHGLIDETSHGLSGDWQLVYGWCLEGSGGDETDRRLQALAYDVPVTIAKVIADLAEGSVRATFLTQRQFSIAGEAVSRAQVSMVLGASRVMATEIEPLRTQVIDVAPMLQAPMLQGGAAHLAKLLVRVVHDETLAAENWSTVALRQGRALVPHYTLVTTSDEAQTYDFGQNATYAITGGRGFIARQLTQKILAAGKNRVALLVRPDSSGKIADLEVDSRVSVIPTDLLDPTGVTEVLNTLDTPDLPLKGVFHTAGTVEDELLATKKASSMQRVFAPKVEATRVIGDAARSFELDFLMLFSSMSVDMGLAGQIDYAAANAFVDTYVNTLRQDGIPAMAVAWDAWENASSKIAGRAQISHPLFESHASEDGRSQRYFVASGNRHWMLDEHRNLERTALIPGTGYINMAAMAYTAETGQRQMTITDVNFLELFALREDERRQIGVLLQDTGGAGYDFAISSHEESIEHATGCVSELSGSPAEHDVPVARSRCEQVDTQLAYVEDFAIFGPRWHSVTDLCFGKSEAVIELRLDPAYVGDVDIFPLHPALLDIATAGAQRLAGCDPNTELLIPFGYGSVDVFADISAHIVSLVRLRPQEGDDFVAFDVDIVDGDSHRSLVAVRDFKMRKVDPSVLAADAPEQEELDQETGIAPDEGMVQIDRILKNLHLDRVLVTPTEPNDALRGYRTPLVDAQGNAEHMDDRPLVSTEYVAPSTDTETALVEIWQKALGLATVGTQDHFFELGGHSLLLTRVCALAQKGLQKKVPVEELFEQPVIEAWATVFDNVKGNAQPVGTPIKKVARERFNAQ